MFVTMATKLYIDPTQQMRDSFRLARTIYESGWIPEVLIGLWRGGTPIAISIHEFLVYKGVKLVHMPVKCSSYTGLKQTHELQIDFPINFMGEIQPRRRVLLIDDCFDTGRTAMRMKALLQNRGAEVRIAVLYWKPANNQTDGRPDYYHATTDQWIVFPHELEGLTEEEIACKDTEVADILGIHARPEPQ